jgi:hypothetical protein
MKAFESGVGCRTGCSFCMSMRQSLSAPARFRESVVKVSGQGFKTLRALRGGGAAVIRLKFALAELETAALDRSFTGSVAVLNQTEGPPNL